MNGAPLAAAAESAKPAAPADIPLALYVHLPWCARKCPYCDFNSHAVRAPIPEAEYVDALIRDLDFELQDLARSDVKFVRVGAQMLLDEMIELDGRLVLKSLPDLAAEDFCQLTRRYGVEVIVEKVESERQIVDLLELEVGYGQGHLFGEPRPIREAVLAEADPPADFLRQGLRRRAGGRI